jgi:2-polyprenyl-3-methyl-5-hydroxy-6-metoxy-1,4-benzoquinol methylase
MSKSDFNGQNLAVAWNEIIGSEGDTYRKSLINPVAVELLRCLSGTDWQGFSSAFIDHMLHSNEIKLEGSSENSVTVLDLGCGEGYLGRLLNGHFKNIDYYGIDSSSKLIDFAKTKSAQSVKELKYSVGDLDNLNLEEVSIKCKPDLIYMITVLDHIADPVKLLKTINDYYGINNSGVMLIVTCNHRFYKANPSSEAQLTYIDSIAKHSGKENAGVTIYYRSKSDYLKIFRDAGLTLLDRASLNLPDIDSIICNNDYENIYDKSSPPFHFWLLNLGGREIKTETKYVTAKVTKFLNEPSISDNHSPSKPLVNKILLNSKLLNELTILNVAKNSIVVGANNLGGELLICISGSAILVVPENTTVTSCQVCMKSLQTPASLTLLPAMHLAL